MNDHAIEQEIVAKGKTAPRVTPADIEENIAIEHYFTAGKACLGATRPAEEPVHALDMLTFCVLVMKNGFTVTGESACASPENFDAEIGRKIARQNAVQKIWPLMGYVLKQQLHDRAVLDAKPKAGGQLIADGLNPHYEGQFEGETAEQSESRRAAARRPDPRKGAPKPPGYNPYG